MYRVSKKNGPFNVFFVSFDEHDYQKLKCTNSFPTNFSQHTQDSKTYKSNTYIITMPNRERQVYLTC